MAARHQNDDPVIVLIEYPRGCLHALAGGNAFRLIELNFHESFSFDETPAGNGRSNGLSVLRGGAIRPCTSKVHLSIPSPGLAAPTRTDTLPNASSPLPILACAKGMSAKATTRPRHGFHFAVVHQLVVGVGLDIVDTVGSLQSFLPSPVMSMINHRVETCCPKLDYNYFTLLAQEDAGGNGIGPRGVQRRLLDPYALLQSPKRVSQRPASWTSMPAVRRYPRRAEGCPSGRTKCGRSTRRRPSSPRMRRVSSTRRPPPAGSPASAPNVQVARSTAVTQGARHPSAPRG